MQDSTGSNFKHEHRQDDARSLWLDAAKGIGIILVVIGHALGGVIDAGMDNAQQSLRVLFSLIYIFHMPLFFMLAGLTIQPRVQKDPAKFGKRIITKVVYPYYLWGMIQLLIIIAAGDSVNHAYSGGVLEKLITMPWNPVSQFWFLQSLALFQLCSLVFLPRIGPAAFLLLAFLFKSFDQIVDLPEIWLLFCIHAPFFGIGVFLGISGIEKILNGPYWIRLILLPGTAAVLAWLTKNAVISSFGPEEFAKASAATIAFRCWDWPSFAAALICTASVVGISTLPKISASSILGYIGRKTFSIFVFHIMFIVGSRLVLVRLLGITELAVLLPLIISIGVIAPLIADAVLTKLGLSKWLGLA